MSVRTSADVYATDEPAGDQRGLALLPAAPRRFGRLRDSPSSNMTGTSTTGSGRRSGYTDYRREGS